jgi:MraZ protein
LRQAIMPNFRGHYDYSIDEKGRVNIPSKFRKLLSPDAEETFVIFRGPENCLWAFPKDEWEKIEDSFMAIPVNAEINRLQRELQNTLTDSELDRQGRITLSPLQMRIAGITKEVSITGRGRFLEIAARLPDQAICNGQEYDARLFKAVPVLRPS